MIKFNINDYIYVQITKDGWKHLEKEVGKEYIKHCIYPYKKEIKGKVWYKLQMHQVLMFYTKIVHRIIYILIF